jgi:hypothetical protein
MLQARSRGLLWGIGVLVSAVWACESSRNPGGVQRDLIPPNIQLTTAIDTQDIAGGLRFSVTATDNLGLKNILLTFTGGYVNQIDTVFTSTVTTITLNQRITPSAGSGGLIRIVGRATDGAGNFSEDELFIVLTNVDALRVYLSQPSAGAVASAGKYIPIRVAAAQNVGVRRIGWYVGGAAGQTAQTGDSVVNGTPPFPDSLEFVDSVLVTGAASFFTVAGFAVDSGNRVAQTSAITVNILSAANDVSAPQIEQTVALRAEANDTIVVHATDPSGITRIGFLIRNLAGTVIGGDSVTLGGTSTDAVRRFPFGLTTLAPLPQQVVIQALGCDAAVPTQNCGVTGRTFTVPSPTGPARADTATIVAGTTVALPFGGKIVDAIYNANQRELYLTNPTLSRVEIFQASNTTFVAAGIPTAGPQPWGVALWPRDTLGAYGDTIVVANSGGTQLSVIDVTPTARVLRWRQDLPDFLIQTYKVSQTGGGFKVQITEYNVSDRPQYLATVCRPAGGTTCVPGEIFALYSTTPEVSNPPPFTGRGTLRMEKLVNPGSPPDTSQLFGHLFWEISNAPPGGTTDTLRVVLRRGPPYNQSIVTLTACAGVNVELASFALGDTTFARNSGNFTHAFFGEGGQVPTQFARVMAYRTTAPLVRGPTTARACDTSPSPTGPRDSGQVNVDFGMSPAVAVNDFISNTATKVRSIATNFNGLTNAARADSIYYLDEGLRLKATSPDSGAASGMDMNYNHNFAPSGSCNPNCGGTGSTDDRILFAARFDGNIDVFDTYFGRQVGTISTRDPIIGPMRVARDAAGNQLLFGITARGLVMLSLPPFPNPPPAPPR